MKSTKEELRKRGQIEQADIITVSLLNNNELMELVNSEIAVERSAAIRLLSDRGNIENTEVVTLLLKRLALETSLYTKLELCEALEKGNSQTAMLMVNYLRRIGNNQHYSLPNNVSKKISYPLPRDIIARSLSKMDTSILSVLIQVLYNGDINQIPEILDSIGYMVFYHQELVSKQLLEHIINTMETYSEDEVIVWKCVLCLSAFPLPKSIDILKLIVESEDNQLIQNEANRALYLISKFMHE